MNVALLFYGEARNIDYGYQTVQNFKSLDKEFDTDVFIHTWDNITKRTKNIFHFLRAGGDINKCILQSNLTHVELRDKYNPVVFLNESKCVLDGYVDKFKHIKPDQHEHNKLAIQLSNTPPFSQMYSTYKVFDIFKNYSITNNKKYDLILITRTDCLFKEKYVTEKNIKWFCKYFAERNYLLVERISLRPENKQSNVWVYNGYMLSNFDMFDSLYTDFPKYPIGMGKDPDSPRTGNSHAEFAKYLLNETCLNTVFPICATSHPLFKGRFFHLPFDHLK